MNSELDEYNKRQLHLMNSEIMRFDNGSIDLRRLITSLEGLLGALDNFDANRKNALLRQWGVLEEVYAVTLDNRQTSVSRENELLVKGAISEITKLIGQL